jgi:hypothetical protein
VCSSSSLRYLNHKHKTNHSVNISRVYRKKERKKKLYAKQTKRIASMVSFGLGWRRIKNQTVWLGIKSNSPKERKIHRSNIWVGSICLRDLILTLHHHNNCTTTPHMRVGPSVCDSPSCEGLLCSCCIGVINLTFYFV